MIPDITSGYIALKRVLRPEFTLFALIAVIYTVCCTHTFSYLNADSDAYYYFTMSVYGEDLSSGPVYSGLGWLLNHIPIGNIVWRDAFFCSCLPAILSSVAVFYTSRKVTKHEITPYICSMTFAGSFIVVSQSTIHEIYAMVGIFISFTALAFVYKKYTLSMVFLSLALLVHWAAAWPFIILTALLMPLKDKIKLMIPVLVGVGLYFTTLLTSQSTFGYWANYPTIVLQGRIEDLPMRTIQSTAIMVSCMGLAWIPLIYYAPKNWKVTGAVLIALVPAIVHLYTATLNAAYVQLYTPIVALSILSGPAIERIQELSWGRPFKNLMLVVSMITLLTLPMLWKVGDTLDPGTTSQQWIDDLTQVPDGSMISTSRTLEGVEDSWGVMALAGVEIVNREYGRNLIVITSYLYPESGYQAHLQIEYGLVTPYNPSMTEAENMKALGEANGRNIYHTVIVNERTIQCDLVEY